MKIILFILALISINVVSGQSKLRAYLDNKQYYAPGIGNYIEFHMQFVGHSFDFKGVEKGLQAELAISLKIKKQDSTVYEDAYRLQSPVMIDSIVDDFYDIKRVNLEPGNYAFSLSIDDMLNKEPALTASHMFTIEDMSDGINISDIEIAELAYEGSSQSPFYKSGLEIIPRLSTFYPEQLNKLPVYFELYQTNLLPDSVFGIKQQIINADTGDTLHHLTSFTRHKVSEIIPLFKTVDLSEVYTGKYILKYSLINRNMKELAFQTYEFERSNEPETDLSIMDISIDPSFQKSITDDSVFYYLESLLPVLGQTNRGNYAQIFKEKDPEQARRYIQIFWTQATPENPYEGWIKYKLQVLQIERLYGTNFQHGYQTDRGRVYLQYGSPTTLQKRDNSADELPYEIWQYNKIGRFSNKIFVFYNPDMVTNNYKLLHSDMVGEIKNPAWRNDLSINKSSSGNSNQNSNNTINQW